MEQQLEQNFFKSNQEKTYIDKLIDKNDIEKIKELVKKEKLTRSELLELMYMCLGAESKLVNYSEWDRYVILKFFVWIREFIKIAELMFDVKEYFEKQEKIYNATGGKDGFKMSERAETMLNSNQRLIEHNAKFLVDLYLNIARTTLSVSGKGFFELLKAKFEISYPQQAGANLNPEKQGLLAKWGLK
jgi:hypothetical protein